MSNAHTDRAPDDFIHPTIGNVGALRRDRLAFFQAVFDICGAIGVFHFGFKPVLMVTDPVLIKILCRDPAAYDGDAGGLTGSNIMIGRCNARWIQDSACVEAGLDVVRIHRTVYSLASSIERINHMSWKYQEILMDIEHQLDLLVAEARHVKALILTESDLKCLLYRSLTTIPALAKPSPTINPHILGTPVHTEVSWYGYPNRQGIQRLSIIPDITIIDPSYLSIEHGLRRVVRYSAMSQHFSLRNPPLPSKGFAFEGNAITFELKFIRGRLNQDLIDDIMADYKKIQTLFNILDRRNEGHTLYSYLVIVDRLGMCRRNQSFYQWLLNRRRSSRHKIIYRSLHNWFREGGEFEMDTE